MTYFREVKADGVGSCGFCLPSSTCPPFDNRAFIFGWRVGGTTSPTCLIHVFCGTDSSPSLGMGLWSRPSKWNSVLGCLLTLLGQRNFLCLGLVNWVDYKPGAAGSHLTPTREVPACYLARKSTNRDLMSGEITEAPDFSYTWRECYTWTFQLSKPVNSLGFSYAILSWVFCHL